MSSNCFVLIGDPCVRLQMAGSRIGKEVGYYAGVEAASENHNEEGLDTEKEAWFVYIASHRLS